MDQPIALAALLVASFVVVVLLLTRRGQVATGRRISGEARVDFVYWVVGPTLVSWLVGRASALIPAALVLLFYPEGADVWRGFGPLATLPAPISMGLALVCADFANYWVHRTMHASRALWPLHSVHHSSIELDWHSALRIHPFDRLAMRLGVLSFLLLVGFPAGALGGAAVLAGLIGVLVHLDVDVDLGPFRFVIATPRFHRWHHASDAQARGKNLAGIFPIWDLLFGTFHMPPHRAPRCGPPLPLPQTLRGHLLDPVRSGWAALRGQ